MIKVSYRFPASSDANKLAQIIATGQTVGSWGAQFKHREQELKAHLADVVAIEQQHDGSHIASIAFPVINTENDIATLLTMIFGKFSLAGPARIIKIELPDNFGVPCKFGIEGIRQLTGVVDRPLFMGIFKPALGLSASDHANLLEQVARAGLDLIKDDEINFNLETAPTLERVKACRKVIDAAKQETGKEILYAVNLSGRADKIVDNARRLIDHGANAFLLNALPYGYSVLESLAASEAVNVPIFTHPALSGAIGGPTSGDADYGIDYTVLLGTLMRHAGADAVLVPAHYGSLPFAADKEFAIRDELRKSISARKSVFPVPSAGIHPAIVRRALCDYGNDVILNAGSAIFDHPMGPAAGTTAFFDALQLAKAGQPVTLQNAQTPALKEALSKWGEDNNGE
jgi:2,3-diketo-5-methylthiopentyl-1-phosphate enolase